MRVPDGFWYVEGQSLSVVPPGLAANGRKHKPRLYSIASTRYGYAPDGRTVRLYVYRAEYPGSPAPRRRVGRKGPRAAWNADARSDRKEARSTSVTVPLGRAAGCPRRTRRRRRTRGAAADRATLVPTTAPAPARTGTRRAEAQAGADAAGRDAGADVVWGRARGPLGGAPGVAEGR